MAEKLNIKIEIFKDMKAAEFTAALSNPDSKSECGGAAAYIAAMACALFERASSLSDKDKGGERLEYICRNLENIRLYMVDLIDQDVRCRAPLRRALKEGGEREIEATRHPACAIAEEVENMLLKVMELALELTELCPADKKHYIAEGAQLSYCAIVSCKEYIFDMVSHCEDETYRYVTKRENEVILQNASELRDKLLEKAAVSL